MLKKDVLGNASSASLNEAFRCSDCLHYKRHAHSAKEDVCSELGIRGVGIAPKCFTPDVTVLSGNTDQFVQVAAIFNSYGPKQRRIFLALLRSSTKKRQFSLGTRLYFKIGRDYVSNYLCGYVLGYTSAGEVMLIGSPERKSRGSSFLSYLARDAEGLLTHTQWKAKQADLRAHNKVFDPSNRVIKKSDVRDDYDPPTIDSAPTAWLTKKPVKRIRKNDSLEFQISG